MPITFQVTETNPETVALPSSQNAFKPEQILPGKERSYSSSTTKKEEKEHYVKNPIQSSFGKVDSSTIKMGSNSFVKSAVTAYSNHHNLVIKPDDVWLAICTQFSNYVNGQSEELRDKFVDFEGKKELKVYGSGTLMTADYVSLSLDMTNQIAKNIKDPSVREWVMPDFTTTTETDRMVGAVVLMAAMKNYFDYKFCLCCNLPSVTLLGEVEDWIKIRERANRLVEFDTNKGYMKEWSQFLLPVLDQFVESIKGNPNKGWWNRIANIVGGGSGPRFLTGWITTFCVFSEQGMWRGGSLSGAWPKIDSQDIPRGYVNVPIKVDDNGKEYDTEMFAGHMVSDILEDGKTLQPRVDWVLFQVNK